MVGGSVAHRIPQVLSRHVLGLRQDVAQGDAELGPCFQDPEARFAERQILPVSVADEVIEHRVVKDRPPGAQVGRLGPHALVGSINPVLRHRGRRPAVVGADLESVADVFLQRGAAARGHHDE